MSPIRQEYLWWSQVYPFSRKHAELCPSEGARGMTLLPIPSHVSRRHYTQELCLLSCSVFLRNAFLASALLAHSFAVQVHNLGSHLLFQLSLKLNNVMLNQQFYSYFSQLRRKSKSEWQRPGVECLSTSSQYPRPCSISRGISQSSKSGGIHLFQID